MSNPHKLAVGQKLWFVARDSIGRSLGGTPITIKKIGRRWAETGNGGRISLETLKPDPTGYPGQGQAYLSKEAFDAENALVRAWDQFLRACQHRFKPPDGVTLMDIAQAEIWLRLRPEKPNG
jgi:hypothetical protein